MFFFYLQQVFVVSNFISFQVKFIWNINLRKQKPSLNWLHQRSIALWKCFWRCTKRAAWYRYGRPESLKQWCRQKLRNLRKLKDILWVYPSPMIPKELLIFNLRLIHSFRSTGDGDAFNVSGKAWVWLDFRWFYDFLQSVHLGKGQLLECELSLLRLLTRAGSHIRHACRLGQLTDR